MKQKRWFLLVDGQVTGPYDDLDTENRIDKAKDLLIWGRGQTEWLVPDKWRISLKTLVEEQTAEQKNSRQWKMRVNQKELSPMNFDELLENLKDYEDLSPVRVWTEGLDDWKEVFQVRQITEELGVSRRKHPRVPVMGTIQGTAGFGELNAKIISISEGGLGINGAQNLQIGEKFSAKLASPNLFIDSVCEVEAVYVGTEGYAGLRFLGLPSEVKSIVIDYVKKFQQPPK